MTRTEIRNYQRGWKPLTNGKPKNTIEAYGVKGLKSAPWRREFKDVDAMLAWAEKNDADIRGTRDLETDSEKGN